MALRYVFILVTVLALAGLGPAALQATPVGSLVQVEGKVELLRQGKLPAVPAQMQDRLDQGDVIRTKSGGRAQVRFIDDTELTVAPGSMVAVESYLYDAPQGTRQAVLHVFRGLVHCVVNRLLKVEEPDFVMKTFTATVGVRGTRWFTLIGINYIGAFTEMGLLQVKSILKDITKMSLLLGGEFCLAPLNQAPTDARRFTPQTLELLRNWMRTGVPGRVLEDAGLLQRLAQTGQPPLMPLPPGQIYQREVPEGLFVPPKVPTPHVPTPTPAPSPYSGSPHP